MTTLTLKRFPEELRRRLEQRAKAHDWTVKDEVVHCLEAAISDEDINAAGYIQSIRPVRRKTESVALTDETLQEAIERGRV
jgi:plasmid stability protein